MTRGATGPAPSRDNDARRRQSRNRASRPISRVLSRAIIHLGPPSPAASSNLPGSPWGDGALLAERCFPIWSCSGWGLPCRDVLPPARCALTAPFHPYRDPGTDPGILRRLFSVALSVGSRLPGVTWHPARRSPDFPPVCKHTSDCLADSRAHGSTSPAATTRNPL